MERNKILGENRWFKNMAKGNIFCFQNLLNNKIRKIINCV